jgi:hypothetical protein
MNFLWVTLAGYSAVNTAKQAIQRPEIVPFAAILQGYRWQDVADFMF